MSDLNRKIRNSDKIHVGDLKVSVDGELIVIAYKCEDYFYSFKKNIRRDDFLDFLEQNKVEALEQFRRTPSEHP
jgi:hypothetical protein